MRIEKIDQEIKEIADRKEILQHRKIIGEAIRQYRKQAGFAQETLAERVDLNWKYLGEVELGEKSISIEVKKEHRIAEIIGDIRKLLIK